MGFSPADRSEADERASSSGLRSRGRRNRRRPQAERRPDAPRLVFALVALATLSSLLAIGAVHVTALLVVTPFALASGVVALLRDRSHRVPAPAVVLLGLAGYSGLQAMPLPIGLVRFLDADTAAIWESALSPFSEPIKLASISLDPGASMVEALKWLSYAAVFTAACSLGVSGRLRWICLLVFGAALLAALVTLGHRLVGAEAFFGVYRPIYALPKFGAAPLLNPNNLAGYLNLGAFAGVGLMVDRRPLLPPWLVAFGVAIVMAMSAVSGSRAGLAALLGGALVVVAGLHSMRFDGLVLPRVARWLVTGSVVAGLALFGLGADREVWRALFQEGAQKLALIAWTKPMVQDHPWLGIGRGAFETAFPAYRADPGHHLYQFAENFVMQWASEWGVPVALIALASLGWFFRPSRVGARRKGLAFAAYVGVLALLGQNLLDLGLEVAGVCIPLFALLGGLWASAAGERPQPLFDVSWARQPGVVFGVACVAVWTGALLQGLNTPLRDRRAVSAAFRAALGEHDGDSAVAAAKLREELRLAVRRHPADPFLPLVGALAARLSRDNPLPWLSRAIERDPMAGRPYFVLAEVMAARGNKSQALLSLRQAVEREEALMRPGIRLALQISREPEELSLAAPAGVAGANMLSAMASDADAKAIRPQLLELAIRHEPTFPRPRVALGEDLLHALEGNLEPCAEAERGGCSKRVAELAAAVAKHDRAQEAPVIFTARLLALSGQLGEPVKYLGSQCGQFAIGVECWRWAVTFAARARDWIALEQAGQRYLAASCDRPNACAGASFWLGSQFERVGDDLQALKMFERSAQESDSQRAWDQVAKVASRLGFLGAAKRARERASRSVSAGEAPAQKPETTREQLRQLVEGTH